MRAALARLFDLFTGEGPAPTHRWWRRSVLLVRGLSLLAALLAMALVTRPVWRSRKAAPIPSDTSANDTPGVDVRFGLTESARRSLFSAMVEKEPENRRIAKERFGDWWRAEDDRAAFERDQVRTIAAKRKINITVAYLVLDEGIRKHWAGPGGTPLPATVPPLEKR